MSRPKRREASGEMALLERILAGRPNLQGAACIGQHGLFDAARDDKAQRANAETLCWSCPVRSRCPETLAIERGVA